MRFAAAASILALASTVLAADPWKNMGGDFAIIGPSFNASVKAGDAIPFEYAFYTLKMVGNNTNTNTTTPPLNTGTVTLTSLAWVGATGNTTVEITWDNNRNTGYSAVCQPADVCTGNYYPKRAELTVPADSYPSNYSLVIGYTLKLVQDTKLTYKFPINVVAASANVTSPVATIADAPVVKATLPVYAAPSSSGLINKASTAVIGATMVLASAMLLL
ncbi:hypothetical protein EC957_011951 [Mortierella hygrophila]|uniref:Uncharacterized protein n=1 Tax=Mortierella hygrophila TaxID=979708 RepID=A0A9P6FH26_9FUNG|nr:hypothetical protein EC957_011951 [Mortierella hygrophila]